MRSIIVALWWCTATVPPFAISAAQAAEPEASGRRQADAEALLAADRAFGAGGKNRDAVVAIEAILDADVIYTTANGKLYRGREAAIEAIAADPEMAGGSVTWRPSRGGVSADGRHGFTYGFLTRLGPNGQAASFKYLAYWIKGATGGWRAAGYKYARRLDGTLSSETAQPLLPQAAVAFDRAGEARHAAGLAAAEQAFSDEAQAIGLARAFAKNGTPESVNMGRGPGFTIGADNVARELFGEPQSGSPIQWSSDGVRVASSGDLGLSWGTIRTHSASPPRSFAFFTIWRRGDTTEPWRYIAE